MDERLRQHQIFEIERIDPVKNRGEIVTLIKSAKLSPEFVDQADVWLGCRMGGKLVGCMALERRGNLVHIQSLSVDKGFRKRGIAKSLIGKGFENYLSSEDTMTALTLFWNIRIYERMGFHKVNAAEMKKMDDVAGREKHKHCVALIKTKL
ncbi:MAG TPA: GNAT family N-acetyltransferase [Patescibacteria group bacterium]|nr:GNAT family N-acetyltransferase [Patescibacteria group bacterium]